MYEGDPQSRPDDAKVIFTCEADTYEEALQMQYDFLGWAEYKSSGYLFDYPPGRFDKSAG
jgi:hypothetical protein